MTRTSLLVALATLVAGIQPALATAPPPTIGHVVVTAPRLGGGNIICTGQACASVIAALSPGLYNEVELPPLLEDFAIDPVVFCNALRNARPAGCDRNNPPSTPLSASWQPNGCGNRAPPAMTLDMVIALSPIPFSGTGLDNPVVGVSFRSPCDAHDRCYGLALPKDDCDRAFARNLDEHCSAGRFGKACALFAPAYYAAVVQMGAAAYSLSVQQFGCASWAKDMNDNGCPA